MNKSKNPVLKLLVGAITVLTWFISGVIGGSTGAKRGQK